MAMHLPKAARSVSSATRRVSTIAVLCLGLSSGKLWAQRATVRAIHVLAASDLQPVMPQLASQFEQAKGIKLVVSFGSSSTLATQVLNGDPADLFLSADFIFAEKIVAAGLADTHAPIPYADGTLVLWARKDSPFQPLTGNTLGDKRVESLAIADPEHAPYGRAAVSALKALQFYDQMQPRLKIAENVSQAAQFVETGNAQLGLISLTLASSERLKHEGSFVRIPPTTYEEIRQCAVVLKASAHRDDAHAFLDWLTSRPIQDSLPKYGLDTILRAP